VSVGILFYPDWTISLQTIRNNHLVANEGEPGNAANNCPAKTSTTIITHLEQLLGIL